MKGNKSTNQTNFKAVKNEKNDSVKISNRSILIFTVLTFVLYYAYSFFSRGFYQDDELGHYFNMREFWNNPNVIVGPWAKFGYKLFYVIPSLMGGNGLIVFNCVLAAFTCFLTYKTAEKIGLKHAVFAFILLATQYFWIEMSFRNYADPFGGLVLLAAVYFHYCGRYHWSALFLSYAAIVRSEFNVLLVFYGLYLLYNKKVIPALLLGVFPLIYDIWGYFITGDMFFALSSSNEFVARQSGAYVHYGFGNFSIMSMVTFGAMQVTLVITCLIELIIDKFWPASQSVSLSKTESGKYVFVILPMLLYFFTHSFIDAGWIDWGASGSLRYMTSISPLVAITGAIGLDKLEKFHKKMWLFIGLVVFTLIVALFMSYKYDGTMFKEDTPNDYISLIITIGTIIVAFLPITSRQRFTAFILASFVFFILVIRPIKTTPEQDTMKAATYYMINQGILKDEKQVLTNHIYFKYFYDKKMNHIYNVNMLDTISAMAAPVGTYMIWDTHYGFKEKSWPKTASMDWYQKKGVFEVKKDFVSNDQRFQVVIMEKIK